MKKIIAAFIFTILIFDLNCQNHENSEQKIYDYDELCKMLSSNNTDLRKAQGTYERSLLDVKDAWANISPTIDFQASGTYMLNPPIDKITLNAADIAGSLGISGIPQNQYITIYDGMENTLYNFELSLQQPVFTWGKISNGIKLYSQISKVQELQLSSKKKQLETELETRILSLWYLYKISEILQEEQTYAERMVLTSEDAQKSGMLLEQDVIEARIQAKELDIALQGVNEQINTQIFELQKMTGLNDLSWQKITYEPDQNEITRILSLNRKEVEEKALSGNQDSIKMLNILKDVNEIAVKVSKASVYWKPDLALQVSAGYSGSRFPLLEPNWLLKDDYSLNISLGLKTTVWDGGKKLNAVSRAISESEETTVSQDESRATIRKTLQEQWNSADVCTMRIEYQDLKIQTAEAKIQQQETLFQNGYGSETDLLSAKIDWCNQRIEKLQQELTRAAACFTIRYLSGD